jgi:hypothetical protein
MRLHRLTFAALTALALGCAAPAYAQEADMTAFDEACAGAQTFLVGEIPADVDSAKLMTALCACVSTAFKTMPQADIDMLVTDLKQTSTEETHAAHPDYGTLQQRAGEGLGTCFGSAEVLALLPPPPAEAPAEPAAPAQ